MMTARFTSRSAKTSGQSRTVRSLALLAAFAIVVPIVIMSVWISVVHVQGLIETWLTTLNPGLSIADRHSSTPRATDSSWMIAVSTAICAALLAFQMSSFVRAAVALVLFYVFLVFVQLAPATLMTLFVTWAELPPALVTLSCLLGALVMIVGSFIAADRINRSEGGAGVGLDTSAY